jgi:hypothetical protein
MGFLDPHGNDGPIEHYYRTGDPSRGYPPSDHLTRIGDLGRIGRPSELWRIHNTHQFNHCPAAVDCLSRGRFSQLVTSWDVPTVRQSTLIFVIEAFIEPIVGTTLAFPILLKILPALAGSRHIGLIALSQSLTAFLNSIADRAV